MTNRKNLKKILIPVSILLVLAIGLGIWYAIGHNRSEPVNVYPFHYLGMTEYWGDSQESYGPVTTDKIQTVYLSNTQTVTEILVSQGDSVKKGDLLMTFDTTLSDLALERERLAVEKLKLQLQDAQKRLNQIKSMKPMVIPTTDPEETDKNLGTPLMGTYMISSQAKFDGSSKEKALICWIGSSTGIDDTIFEAIRQKAEEYQIHNAETAVSASSSQLPDGTQPSDIPAETPSSPPTESPEETPSSPPTEPPADTPTEAPTEPEPPLTVNQYYVIFKVTQSDMSLGQNLVWQGMVVTKTSGHYSFKLFDADNITDHLAAQLGSDQVAPPQIDLGSGYTASQIAQMRSEQEKTIKDIQFQIKMAEAEYKIKLTEASDGNVYAQIDGEVVSVLTEEEAKLDGQPILKVSGGGGFYVQGSVSELEKDNLKLGQEVTINDWSTGMTYTGTIHSLGDFPSTSSTWNGQGNPNTSYYPFTVFVDGDADLQAGRYVSMMYASATAQNGLYLENPFLRTENGQSYVYILGENGKLEKRIVTTGKSLWGSYTEILDGITAEDYIAFPYGKNIKEGVQAVECEDLSKLYE